MNPVMKKAREIQNGDKIQIENCDWVTVTGNHNGMLVGHRMIDLSGVTPNCAHVPTGSIVEVIPAP